jgi:predicted Rossmann-fold nucleotide-binding protein
MVQEYDGGEGVVVREWRSPWDSRLLRSQFDLSQRAQQAGKVSGRREANLYGSGVSGLMEVGLKAAREWWYP